jgi:hypothetical protein
MRTHARNKGAFSLFIEHDLAYNQQKIAAFKENLHIDNCDDIFAAVARVEVITRILSSLNDAEAKGESQEDRIAFLIEYYSRERQSMGKWPRQSTSVTSNLYHRYQLAAICEILEMLETWVSYRKEAADVIAGLRQTATKVGKL